MSLTVILSRLSGNIQVPQKFQYSKYFLRNFSITKQYSSHVEQILSPPSENDQKVNKKKTVHIPKITLISPGDTMSVTTLEEAQKLSKRRDLKLIKTDFDTKSQRPIYKLLTGSEYFAEEQKQREKRKEEKKNSGMKGEKLLSFNSRISEHDLNSKIKNISKWLAKNYQVQVAISGESDSNMELAEKVYSTLENSLKSEARFVQKRKKLSDIRFQILPPKRNNSGQNSDSSDS